jgi:hypothetical protein
LPLLFSALCLLLADDNINYHRITSLKNRTHCITIDSNIFLPLICSNSSGKGIAEETLRHDMLTSKLLLDISQFDSIIESEVVDTSDSVKSESIPDAFFVVNKGGRNLRVYIELELTAKSKTRIFSKFSSINNDKSSDVVLYVFNSQWSFNSYKRRVIEFYPDIRKCKILLALCDDISNSEINFNQIKLWGLGEDLRFTKFFNLDTEEYYENVIL